ncbi:MAG: hypothetical protein ACJ746_30105 [Bryobacteraceae bacterium]
MKMIFAVSLAMAMTDSITAATIFTSTDILSGSTPTNPEQNWQVSITSTLTDNFNGDFTRQEWRYSVANISYVPNQIPPGVGSLIGSGVTLFFVPVFGTTPLGTGPFQNYFEPADWVARFSGFVGDFTRVDPVLWRTELSSAAILPGQSAEFGFSIAGPVALSEARASVSAEQLSSFPGPIDVISGSIPVPVPVPEPMTLSLGAGSILVAASIRRHGK